MRIVQIAPRIAPGSGIAGVAWNLEREFRDLGHTVERFTRMDARGGRMRAQARTRLGRMAAAFGQTIWDSTIGTARARAFLRERPDAVSLCHKDVLAGDVFVDHGIVGLAMRSREVSAWYAMLHPTYLFTSLRERMRFRGPTHRAVVAVSRSEAQALKRVFRRVTPPITVISNGVDLERFRPPTPQERADARGQFRLDGEDRVALFVGHDFEGKGLAVAIDALEVATTILLLVAGGTTETIAKAQAHAQRIGVADRVLFMGPRTDLPLFFAASDMLVLPSGYEAHGLVVLEALASGVPVIATAVGCVPDVIVDGVNGYVVDRDPVSVATRLEELAAADLTRIRVDARRAAEAHEWRATAERYVELLESIRAQRETAR